MAHILRDFAETEVDVDESGFVAREPTGLESESAAENRPFCAVV